MQFEIASSCLCLNTLKLFSNTCVAYKFGCSISTQQRYQDMVSEWYHDGEFAWGTVDIRDSYGGMTIDW